MRITNLIAAAAAGLALTAAPALAACDDGETVIKFSHVTNTDKHPKGIAASLLAERVNAEMDGTACMEVYPNSTLYNDDKVFEAMLTGDVQMAAPSLSKFENFTKKYRLFDLPFLFEDIDAVDRFQNSSTGQGMLDIIKRRGLQGLSFWHNGMKQMSASEPLLDPSDAEGLKFRVQPSEVLIAQFEAIGANPQKMAFSEVYGALQQGVVDGQENTWSNIYGKKFFEVQDGVTETNHGIIDYMVVTSLAWWEGLEPEVRDQLATILAEVTETRNAAAAEVNQQNKQAIMDAGGEVRQLTAGQREAWIAAMKPVWNQFEGDIGADLIAAAQSANGGS